MTSREFLNAEIGHAERHLARTRRLQAKMQAGLEGAGLDEVAVYEKLAAHKAYRQLQRDESFYQQMWLRLNRHLERYSAEPKAAPARFDWDKRLWIELAQIEEGRQRE